MRSFQQIVALLFALVAFAFAQDPTSYVATTTLTSTIQIVMTSTLSPGASSTHYSMPHNSTVAYPTGTSAPSAPASPSPAPTEFPGAASGLSANGAFIAALAAGLGYLAL